MVEQLKWMYALEVIAHSKTGQLYLYKRPPQDMVIPDSLEELIACRIEFFKKRSPEIVSLLALCAQIGNEVIGPLFEKLALTLRTPAARRKLSLMDVAAIPTNGNEPFRFLHENYFRFFKQSRVAGDIPALQVAVAWHDDLANPLSLNAPVLPGYCYFKVHRLSSGLPNLRAKGPMPPMRPTMSKPSTSLLTRRSRWGSNVWPRMVSIF